MSNKAEPVLLDVSERIALVTLNRPESRNALTSDLLRLLPQVLATSSSWHRKAAVASSTGRSSRRGDAAAVHFRH
jgi:enoyl-CoA hydratase/carnithine racemase